MGGQASCLSARVTPPPREPRGSLRHPNAFACTNLGNFLLALMPQRKTSNKSAKRQRKAARSGIIGVTSTPLIIPSMFRGKMAYDTVIAMSPAAGVASANVFRWNSVYDPDFTGVGSSVAAYSQMSALYNRYRVMGAKMTVSFVNISTTTPLTCFIALNPVNTVGINIAQILAQRHVWTRSLGTVAGNASVTHTVAAPVHLIYGVPKRQVRDEDDFAGLAGANPNNVVYAHVGAYANGASSGNYNLHVRIEYDVVWSLPLQMT